jgi:hypothetical protein
MKKKSQQFLEEPSDVLHAKTIGSLKLPRLKVVHVKLSTFFILTCEFSKLKMGVSSVFYVASFIFAGRFLCDI